MHTSFFFFFSPPPDIRFWFQFPTVVFRSGEVIGHTDPGEWMILAGRSVKMVPRTVASGQRDDIVTSSDRSIPLCLKHALLQSFQCP